MNGNEIRQRFLGFFSAREHTVRPSASLIPIDPTLLLTVAGMVPFKPYLLGEEVPPYRRATSAQKCVRTADIDIVGTTARHMTFFEMLGNFSFGDYFKKEAIGWAYQFVTEELGIDPSRLWFTVHETDDEAAGIWMDQVGVPAARLQRGGKDNFWQMGVPGPAGPSSEIFVDRGERYGEEGGPIGGDEERFVEIWNLVFMQNLQDEPYHVIGELPAKNIDTGMGLERTAMVLQDRDSAFECDLVWPVLEAAASAVGVPYGGQEESNVSLRLLADHGRAMTFLVGDGVVPSNEGRGYVLRRLVRRAVRHAWSLGGEELVTANLVRAVVEVMGAAYPELPAKEEAIVEVLGREESRFRRSLESGHQLLDAELEGLQPGQELSGQVAFKLHDTYGFPVELTTEILAERGMSVDRAGFDSAMDEQRRRARAAWKRGGQAGAAEAYRDLFDDLGPTHFTGYRDERGSGRILAILREGESVERAEAGDAVELFLDTTPFYGESGGQVGDRGVIDSPTGRLEVTDTQHALQGFHSHRAKVASGWVQVGQEVEAAIDAPRREHIRKSHTGTHILHWAIRQVLGSHAQQAGSLVEAGRLRFDFSHHAAVAAQELTEIERLANRRVIENGGVATLETSRTEAEQLGALAFFGDKYGDNVRVVSIGTFSTELCGGTHTQSAGQVGPLVVLGESSIGSNLRRVEAYTGEVGYEHLVSLRGRLLEAGRLLKSAPADVPGRVNALLERAERLQDQLAEIRTARSREEAAELAASAESVQEARLVVAERPGLSLDQLRTLALAVRDRLGRSVVVLGSTSDGKGSLVATVSKDLVASGVAAASMIGEAAQALGGGASRDPEVAQAGGPRGDQLGVALELARTAAGRALTERKGLDNPPPPTRDPT